HALVLRTAVSHTGKYGNNPAYPVALLIPQPVLRASCYSSHGGKNGTTLAVLSVSFVHSVVQSSVSRASRSSTALTSGRESLIQKPQADSLLAGSLSLPGARPAGRISK